MMPDLRPVDIGGLDRCNNDHGFLPDGRIVFSCHTIRARGSMSRTRAMGTAEARDLGLARPSWWHGAHGRLITYACARGATESVRIAVLDMETGDEMC
ncbi:hypothetical protein CUV01_00055 [Paracoccus tegillarcae]|uniref:Uncharacterized protein n=2 Tax=Paracoccus tegillarcae TaxID=1529068 RepID=A0A2K9ECK3_9RHOB|nr:hypothetical protein CUV01_00055 [Paracoccus tegillarcae]